MYAAILPTLAEAPDFGHEPKLQLVSGDLTENGWVYKYRVMCSCGWKSNVYASSGALKFQYKTHILDYEIIDDIYLDRVGKLTEQLGSMANA